MERGNTYYFSGGILVKLVHTRTFLEARLEVIMAGKLREQLAKSIGEDKLILLPLCSAFDIYG
jgi:hypothetical protein